jgi:hypothetical protein
MQTQAQLCDQLLALGIDRDLRTLTDWRQKGLLPPLQRTGAGRGRGVKWYWSQDVLDQAIAADWLLERCRRADRTRLGLWLSGYPVDARDARRAWVQHLKRVQRQGRKAASRYRDGFLGLGQSWWRRQSTKMLNGPLWRELLKGDLEPLADVWRDGPEWLLDDLERDDEAYRYAVADLIIRLAGADRKGVYRQIEWIWKKVDPVEIFAITRSLKFVRSISLRELNAAQRSVAQVARMLRHSLQMSGPTDRVSRVTLPLLLMRGIVGPVIVKVVIHAKRLAPELPLQETISTLHDFVMKVQLTDIDEKNDNINRARIKWGATQKKLRQIWSPILN